MSREITPEEARGRVMSMAMGAWVSLPDGERTESQWRGLLAGANLAVAGIHPISGSDLSVVEAGRAEPGGNA